jgi:hypothetical protein
MNRFKAGKLSIHSENVLELTESRPNWNWDADLLSGNKYITPKFVESHLDWKWNMIYLSMNPMIGPKKMMFKPAKK